MTLTEQQQVVPRIIRQPIKNPVKELIPMSIMDTKGELTGPEMVIENIETMIISEGKMKEKVEDGMEIVRASLSHHQDMMDIQEKTKEIHNVQRESIIQKI